MKLSSIIGKQDIVKSNVIVVVCAVLIAVNIGIFVFFPKLLAPMAIVLSNAITVILMAVAVIPISHLLKNAFNRKAHELVEKEKEESALKDKVQTLENQNRELMGKLDTWGQMASAPSMVSFTAKVETMLYQKDGYIVKEEKVKDLISDEYFKPSVPETFKEKFNKWRDDHSHSGDKTILYIGRHRADRVFGIDFAKVKYAFEDGRIAIYGASITKLHNLETSSQDSDIEHCWVLNNDPDPSDKKKTVVSINKADHYSEIPDLYKAQCHSQADEEIDAETDALCRHYTQIFRQCLQERFPGLVFFDSIDDSTYTWYAINENPGDSRVAPIVSGMFLIANVLHSFEIKYPVEAK